MTKIHFPQFSREEYSPFEMRQLVQVLELRFQQIESNASTSLPTLEDDAGEFAPVNHTHREADIDDLSHVSSIFELTDVNTGFSEGQTLVWDESAGAFVAGEAGSGGVTTLSLDDLTDVSVQSFSSGDVLTYNGTTGLWEPAPVDVGGGVGVDTLLELTDTSVASRVLGDFLWYANPNWQPTGANLRWNIDLKRLELGNAAIISWKNSALVDVDFLTIDSITTTPAPAEAISAYLSFTQTEPGLMSTYGQVVDESGYSHAITYGTTAYVDDGTLGIPPRTGGGTFFDPQNLSDSWVELAPSSTFDLGTGDFCIEIWAYRALGNPNINSGLLATGNLGWRVWWMSHSQGGDLRLQLNDVDVLSVEVATWTEDGAWNHIVFSRSGTTITLYFNGIARGSVTSSADFTSAGGAMIVGEGTYNYTLVSYMPMDDFRLTKGYPVYTEDFTPPDPGYPDIVEERFVVGDPDYVAHVDGTRVELEHDVGIRWDDGEGTKIEKLIFGPYNDTGFATEPDSGLANVIFLASFENAGVIQAPTSPMNGAVDIGTTAGGTSLRWFEKLPERTDNPIVEVSTTQAQFGDQSLYCNGVLQFSSGYFGVYIYSDHRTDTDLQWGTDDWTLELHIYIESSTAFSQCGLLAMDSTDTAGNDRTLGWTLSSGGQIMNGFLGFDNNGVYDGGGFTSTGTGMSLSDGQWRHLVLQKFGTQLQGFVDGVRKRDFFMAEAAAGYPLWIPTASDPVQGLQIGGVTGAIGSQMSYYIDNIRITRGLARYQTSTFTPPAGPYQGTSFPKAFIVGDPRYPTVIDGTSIELNADVNVNDSTLSILDITRQDSAAFSHDGTDFNTVFTGTTDWNLTGADLRSDSALVTQTYLQTGAYTYANKPLPGTAGRTVYLTDRTRPIYDDGTFWRYSDGSFVDPIAFGSATLDQIEAAGIVYAAEGLASGKVAIEQVSSAGTVLAGKLPRGQVTVEQVNASGTVLAGKLPRGEAAVGEIGASGVVYVAEGLASGSISIDAITASGTATKV